MVEGLIFLIGVCVGSFLNVCIHRLPRNESIVWPGSRCPSCAKPLAWYDNIPIISFLVLRARCRSCGAGISWRYPVVELLGGLLAVRHQHIHTHYARYQQGVAAVAFAEKHGWLPPLDGQVYEYDALPQMFADYAAGKLSWFPVFKVNA